MRETQEREAFRLAEAPLGAVVGCEPAELDQPGLFSVQLQFEDFQPLFERRTEPLGADAVMIGNAAMMALGCNAPRYGEDYAALGTAPGKCHHCHTGRCPVGITTQDPELENA